MGKRQLASLGLLLLFVPVAPVRAAFEAWGSGVRPQGMGGAFTAIADDPSAIHWNPAGLAQMERGYVTTFYQRLYGGVDGLHSLSLDLACPLHWGTVGLSLQEAGFDLDKERAFTFSHGFPLTKDLAFGYNLVLYDLWQERFGSQTAFGLDLSLRATVYKRWQLGCFFHNMNRPEMGNIARYQLPRLLNAGVAYEPFPGVTTSVDLSKEVGYATKVRVGQEFGIIENLLTLRAGVESQPQQFGVRYSAGLGLLVKGVRLDYALVSHEILPMTHQIALGHGLSWGKR